MKKIALLVAAFICLGCDNSKPSEPSKSPAAPYDPNIHIKQQGGGIIGPVGAGGSREYDGPASKAPVWAKIPKNDAPANPPNPDPKTKLRPNLLN